MKKIFWTSIVWIILILGFAAYMRWFGQPVAQEVANFIYQDCEVAPDLDCDCPVYMDDEFECPACEECEVEVAECNCPSQVVSDSIVKEDQSEANWTSLFSQLDRIESLVKSVSNGEERELTDEEIAEAIKARREANQ